MAIIIRRKVPAAPAAPIVKGALQVAKPAPAGEPVLDSMYLAVRQMCSANAALSWFLMASYAYYIHDKSIVSDSVYDGMAKDILANFEAIDHQHKFLVDRESLVAGSLYKLSADGYPEMTKAAARILMREQWGVQLTARRQ